MYPSDVEIEFDWHLTNRCNFDCIYCHPQIKKVLNKKDLTEPPARLVVGLFNNLGRICGIMMSGGEPFLYPDYVDLCVGLTDRHYIAMNTNLSAPTVQDFAERVDPRKVVRIAAAFHQPERERLGIAVSSYIENLLVSQEKGFNVTALYVMYPPLLNRIEQDIDLLTSVGVKSISAKVFKGVYSRKRYPEAYSDEERSVIQRVSGDYRFNQPYIDGQVHFKGLMCTAGQRSFKISVTGQVYRCATVRGDYGNFYNGTFQLANQPEPCTASRVLVLTDCHRALVKSPIMLEEE